MPDIKELFEPFIKECRYSAGLSKDTLRGYQASFDLLIKLFPNIVLADISPGLMTEFFRLLEKRERVVGRGIVKIGVKSSTVLTYRYKLGKFFDWLVAREYLKENPFKGMKNPAVRYEDLKYLSKGEIEKIFLAVSHGIEWQNDLVKKRNLAIITLFVYTGLRRGELMQLKMADVNLDKRVLSVRAETSKSRRPRLLPLHYQAAESLNDYLQVRKVRQYATPYLFVSNNRDDRLTFDGLKHIIEAIKSFSGVRFHVHRFRHTTAVNMLNMGADLVVIQQTLGHTDIRMTAKYLRKLPQETIAQSITSLDIRSFVGS